MTIAVRPSWAEIDLDVLHDNVVILKREFGSAKLCAVVKADGYGHGSVRVARTAVEAGADWLAVALVEEGELLRRQGLRVPILVLSQPPLDAMRIVVENELTPTLYTVAAVDALARAVPDTHEYPVHVKVDTGMHRVGADHETAALVVAAIESRPNLSWHGLFSHFAVADENDNPFTAEQARRFSAMAARLGASDDVLLHLANTAGSLSSDSYRHSLVRTGGGMYGVAPSPEVTLPRGIEPVMSVRSRVTHVKRLGAGEALSYGQHYRLQKDSNIAVIPLGYADGVSRNLGTLNQDVLIDGLRFPMAGNVTMDQTIIDCGDHRVEVGAEVTLIGGQGGERITVEEWANKLGTIGYEIVCRIGPRLTRRYVDSTSQS